MDYLKIPENTNVPVEVKLNLGMIFLGIALGTTMFLTTPRFVNLLKDTKNSIGKHWSHTNLLQKGLLLFLGTGVIVPYTSIAFFSYVKTLEKTKEE